MSRFFPRDGHFLCIESEGDLGKINVDISRHFFQVPSRFHTFSIHFYLISTFISRTPRYLDIKMPVPWKKSRHNETSFFEK